MCCGHNRLNQTWLQNEALVPLLLCLVGLEKQAADLILQKCLSYNMQSETHWPVETPTLPTHPLQTGLYGYVQEL